MSTGFHLINHPLAVRHLLSTLTKPTFIQTKGLKVARFGCGSTSQIEQVGASSEPRLANILSKKIAATIDYILMVTFPVSILDGSGRADAIIWELRYGSFDSTMII